MYHGLRLIHSLGERGEGFSLVIAAEGATAPESLRQSY